MKCINRNHPDFQRLLKQTKLPPLLVEAKISLWMEQNKLERFPSDFEFEALIATKNNPIRDLGIKYNMNTSGYMPKNVDLAQVQKDARKFGLKVVRARSGNWYLKDGNRMVNPFKQYQLDTTESTDLPIKELSDRLYKWAEVHGIKIEAMEEMIDRFSDNQDLYSGAVAMADFLNKIIVLNKDKENITTLAEEVAHFATAILADSPAVKRAQDKVIETDTYEKVKEDYKDIYTREEDFRKEAVDKLLAEAIVEEFKETENNKGILAYLKGIFSKFQKWISGVSTSAKDEIKDSLYPLAQSILTGDYLGQVESIDTSQPVFLQTTEQQEETQEEKKDSLTSAEKRKQKFVEDSINLLKTRKKWLSTKKPESSKKVLEVINKTILELEKSLRLLQLDEGMNSLLELVNSELDAIESQLNKAAKKGKINTSTSDLIRRFNEMYINHFGVLAESLIYYGFPEDQIEKYREVLNNMTNRINSLDRTNNDLSKGIAEELGISSDLYEDTKEDLSWWRFYAGNLKYATSDLVKKALKLVKDNIMATKRLAVGVANDLLQAQTVLEADGHKIEEIISSTTDENGKVTYSQYFVDKYDWKSYYEKKSEALQDIAKTLGYESYNQINPMSLTKDQKKIRNKALKLFDEKYSKKIFDAATLTYKKVPKKLDSQYDKIMNENHPEFSASLKAYYLKVMQYNREAVNKLPKSYRTEAAYRMLPGVRKQFLERFFQSDNSFLQNIKESLRESLIIDEDDTQFGMKMEDINAMNNKMVPIFFTNKIPLSNLSLDVTRSMTVFSEMAENFQRMNKISGQLETLLYWTGERKYIKNRQKTDGNQSYEYRTLDLILNAHVYGIKKDDVRVNIFGKEISVTKLNQSIAKYISTNNLALNPVTSTSGAVKGAIDSTIEDQIGLYSTIESKNFARAEFMTQSMKASADMFNKKQRSKIQLLLQLTNIAKLNKVVKSTNSNALAREIIDRDLLFVNYRLADFGLKGRSMIAIMDNHRLYNGKFISKYNFTKAKEAEGLEYTNPKTKKKGAGKDAKQINKEWKDLREKSLYSAYEVVGNQLVIKEEFKEYVNDETLNRVTGIIEHVTHKIDGTLSDTDKGQLARTAYGDFVLMHRGWFINLIDSRFMPETKLEQTGEYEMGAYRAFGKYMWENLIQEGKLLSFRSAFRELSPHQQRGVKTTILDLIYLNIVAFIAALANVAADENEEDWTTQYFAFQMNRILLEQKSGWSPNELLQLIDEPVVGVTTLKDLVNIFDAFSPEVYESGIYKGSTHASKWWWKRLPFKNITELKHPDLKNRFIRQVVDSPTYNMLMDDEDKIRKMNYSDRMSSFFTYQEDILSNQEILDRLDTFEEFEDGNLP